MSVEGWWESGGFEGEVRVNGEGGGVEMCGVRSGKGKQGVRKAVCRASSTYGKQRVSEAGHGASSANRQTKRQFDPCLVN